MTLSSLILVGIIISYLPQHIRIIHRRSSFGLSPYFVLLGTTSSTCAFANILVLPASRADLACCKEISGFACFASLLGIAQVGVQWFCFTVMYDTSSSRSQMAKLTPGVDFFCSSSSSHERLHPQQILPKIMKRAPSVPPLQWLRYPSSTPL